MPVLVIKVIAWDALADFDNDGDTDLYVTNFGHDVFYLNEGDGTFKDVTKELGIENKEMGASAAFFDSDKDGWLDLYVTNYVQYSTDENLSVLEECTHQIMVKHMFDPTAIRITFLVRQTSFFITIRVFSLIDQVARVLIEYNTKVLEWSLEM